MPNPPSIRTRLLSILDTTPSPPRLPQTLLALATTAGLFPRDPFVSARIINLLSFSSLPLAQLAFDSSPRPSAFAYNVLIRAHSAGPTPSLSPLLLFSRMRRSGLFPDRFTFPFLIRASASHWAPPLHGLTVRYGLADDSHIATSLLHSYAGSSMDLALKMFDEMPERTTVTWSAIISCCAKSTCRRKRDDGLSLFSQMLFFYGGPCPNVDTFIAALSCCGVLTHSRSVHAILTRHNVGLDVAVVATALVHMYARCGSLRDARTAFEAAVEVRDASTWTAMIGGLAMHGRGIEAVELFEKMVAEGVMPDSLTITSVLHACSHAGLVEVGVRLFDEMEEAYGIEARMEHYGAVVDLLGRAGRLEAAVRVVESMPFEPNQVVLGSLLHGCMVNGDVGVVREMEGRLIALELGVEEGGFSVGVSNVYARNERWHEVGRVRDGMVEKGVKKEIGYSLVEVNGRVQVFLVGDRRNPLVKEMHGLLCGINRVMMLV